MKHLFLLLSVGGSLLFLTLAVDFGGIATQLGATKSKPLPESADTPWHHSETDQSTDDPLTAPAHPKLVLLKFGAPWCPPCRMVDQELTKLKRLKLPVEIRKINVDDHQALADRYGVTSIPRLILKEDDVTIGDIVGYQSADQLETWIRDNASKAALSAKPPSAPAAVHANPFFK